MARIERVGQKYFERSVDEFDETVSFSLKDDIKVSMHEPTSSEPWAYGLLPSITGAGAETKLTLASWWVGPEWAFHTGWDIRDAAGVYSHKFKVGTREDDVSGSSVSELAFSELNRQQTIKFCNVLSPGNVGGDVSSDLKFRLGATSSRTPASLAGKIPDSQAYALWAACILYSERFDSTD